MCLNCGCGQPDLRHTETDLVRDDIRKAAQGQGQTVSETVGNIERSLREVRPTADRESTAVGTQTGGSTR